jgi:hypothetical protein
MNLSNKATDLVKALCATAVMLISVNACTEVNDELGGDMLPKNQKMAIRINKLGGVRMFTTKQDTLIGSGLGKIYIGKSSDATFGRRTGGAIVQFLPYALPYDGRGYGLDPIVDSLVITMPFVSVDGNYDVEQQFNVYAIDWSTDPAVGPDSLCVDSTYYTSFSPVEYYDEDKLLFTFTHSGKTGLNTRLIPTAAGEEYLSSIVNFDVESYVDDNLFRNRYKGWYITPAADSRADAAIYGVAISDYTTAFMGIYVRNHDTLDRSAIYDTVAGYFGFDDQIYNDLPFGNVSINMIDFDYSDTPIESALSLTAEETPQTVTYIQPMGGVNTRLEFTDELVETLRELRNQKDNDGNVTTYPGIMINQAEMYVYLKDDATATLDGSMKRVGSYLNPNTLAYTPDYLFSYEATYQQTDDSYMLPYNGYLDRSRGYYKMDITSYIQQLAKEVEQGEKPAISQTVYLAPAAYSFFASGQSVVQNGDDEGKQIEIKITYTLID